MTSIAFRPAKARNRLLLILLFAAIAQFASAQSPAPPQPGAPASPFAFDAVTIKPDSSANGYWKNTADGFSMSGPLIAAIYSAFGVHMENQFVGMPSWVHSDHFAIEAKMDPETAAALGKLPPTEQWHQRTLMLQALLADRFALKFHHATKELPVYELTVAKGGIRMKKSASETGGHGMYSNGKIEATSTSLANLVMNLPSQVGRIVIDKTGLEGAYDVTLEWAPEGADSSDTLPSIFTAIEEQLGLKLVPAKDPVDVIVVDHIERPSEN